MVLPPCHYGFQVYTRELSFNQRYRIGKYQPYNIEGKVEYEEGLDYITQEQFELFHHNEMNKLNIPTRAISLMWNQRSCDFPLGIPTNIQSYALLLIMISKQVNMVPDELIGNLGDCHIYLNQIDGCKEQIGREPFELPTIVLSDRIVSDISEYTKDDIELVNYHHHPKIYFPLSN
jgi:thymidylate synthase